MEERFISFILVILLGDSALNKLKYMKEVRIGIFLRVYIKNGTIFNLKNVFVLLFGVLVFLFCFFFF